MEEEDDLLLSPLSCQATPLLATLSSSLVPLMPLLALPPSMSPAPLEPEPTSPLPELPPLPALPALPSVLTVSAAQPSPTLPSPALSLSPPAPVPQEQLPSFPPPLRMSFKKAGTYACTVENITTIKDTITAGFVILDNLSPQLSSE
jgi:hypothetical protein